MALRGLLPPLQTQVIISSIFDHIRARILRLGLKPKHAYQCFCVKINTSFHRWNVPKEIVCTSNVFLLLLGDSMRNFCQKLVLTTTCLKILRLCEIGHFKLLLMSSGNGRNKSCYRSLSSSSSSTINFVTSVEATLQKNVTLMYSDQKQCTWK